MRHKILQYFEIQMGHLILARWPDRVLIKKKKKELAIQWILLSYENKSKWKDKQILRPYQGTKKLWNMRMTVIPIVVGALGMVPKGLEKSLKEL